MAKFIDKMMDMMKLNDYEDEQEDIDVREDYIQESAYRQTVKDNQEEQTRSFRSFSGGKDTTSASKVVNFQASVQMEVVVIQPESYDEAQDICDHIKSQRPVIINLENMERNVAQRIMDFVSGSCYTLNGNLQRVTNNIFIIAPENVDVAGDFREELKSNGIILPWKTQED
ncbi:cell division protein SepF [Petrocella sp. FN5]|uniref:cell division protein SepF n=1 Tax=Petrocella sp. FN5 TaxID=3032002 RepID=UPI0023DAC868|nr:cell division protein SepF [Petrocella sp. FN5]MDF1616314.1 cell division protein SepF [Petrocella sp. FN5]